MATIPYKYEPPKPALADAQRIYQDVKIAGGYNPATNTFTPLKLDDKHISFGGNDRPMVYGSSLFETIAAALEAGIVDEQMWPTQLFANAASFRDFIVSLRDFEECFKLRDPWWSALRVLAGGWHEEEGYSTAADLAERLVEVIDDLPEQWA